MKLSISGRMGASSENPHALLDEVRFIQLFSREMARLDTERARKEHAHHTWVRSERDRLRVLYRKVA